MGELSETSTRARALAAAVEPFVGQVYFSPECHANYEHLGFGPSSGSVGGVSMPEIAAYFTSRGSLMGQVPGEVVAAAFGVFKPAIVVPSVAHGWTLTDAPTIEQARTDGALGQLRRILGASPEGVEEARALLERAVADLEPAGKPLFAGVRSQSVPDDALGASWRLADQLREYRGDAHVAVWTGAGLDACEIGLLSELYWGLPNRSYSRTRGWDDDDYGAAEDRLAGRDLFAEGELTAEGRTFREQVEVETDELCRPFLDALGDDLDDLVSVLQRWSNAVRDAAGYPAKGPIELAEAARR